MKRVVVLAAIAVVLIAGCGALWIYASLPRHGSESFPVVETSAIYNVNDAGVGDLNGDGILDRWTTNHSGAQVVLLSDDSGSAGNANIRSGLSQDPALPGMEESGATVPMLRPIRVYMDDTTFVFEADGITTPVSGTMTLPWRAEAQTRGGAIASRNDCDQGFGCTRIAFTLNDDSTVRITPIPPRSDGFASDISFAEGTDLDLIQVGETAARPPALSFSYASRDRHAMALADPDGDGAPELFISRGGVRGRVADVDPEAQDDLLAWGADGFVAIPQNGIDKAACPGRQAAWIDVDDDGDLDLYVVCGRASSPGGDFPNRLYLTGDDGQRTEEAASLGLDLPGAGTFRFVPSKTGGAPLVMLWATRDAVAVLQRGSDGVFDEVRRYPRDAGLTDAIILRDIDEGWEAGVLSAKGNLWIGLSDDGITLRDAAPGLPATSADGAFVDVSGDGVEDFFSVPQGLFLGDDAGGFVQSDALDIGWAGAGADVRFAWIDVDADGDLDLWFLKRHGLALPRVARAVHKRLPIGIRTMAEDLLGRGAFREHYWSSEIYENRLANGGRVESLAVSGPAGNAQGIGRALEVQITGPDASKRTHYTMVGGSDTSRFSSTLHKVYIPLGPGETIGSVRMVGYD